MNSNGKRTRRQTGLNRHSVKHASHTRKSPEKIRRSGWIGERKEHGERMAN